MSAADQDPPPVNASPRIGIFGAGRSRQAEPVRTVAMGLSSAVADRCLGPDHSHCYATPDGRVMKVQDPLHQLVYRFTTTLTSRNREPIRSLVDAVTIRLDLYAAVLSALDASR